MANQGFDSCAKSEDEKRAVARLRDDDPDTYSANVLAMRPGMIRASFVRRRPPNPIGTSHSFSGQMAICGHEIFA